MTHLKRELDNICRDWCPLIECCAEEHECGNRIKIRRLILEIAGLNDEKD